MLNIESGLIVVRCDREYKNLKIFDWTVESLLSDLRTRFLSNPLILKKFSGNIGEMFKKFKITFEKFDKFYEAF